MYPVSVQLRDLVKQKLAAAAEEIFEHVERTIIKYEEETQRQRTLLEYLLLPRVRLNRIEDPSEPVHIKDELQRPSHIKEEQDDIIITELCSGLKTKEPIPVPWDNSNPSAPQTQPFVGGYVSESSWASLPFPQTEEDPLTPTHTEEESLSPTQTDEEPLPPIETEEEPLPPIETEEEPLPPIETEEEPLPPIETEEEPLPPIETEEEPLPPIETEEEPLPTTKTKEEPLTSTQTEEEPQTLIKTKEEPLTSTQMEKEPLMRVKTRKKSPTFVCSFCGCAFKFKNMLINHMRLQHVERPFRCSVCGKGFIRNDHLRRHIRSIHNSMPPKVALSPSDKNKKSVRRHCCGICNKRFDSRSSVERHMTVHTGDKPFRCSVCEKRFTQKSSLNVHLRDFHPSVALEIKKTATRAPREASIASVGGSAATVAASQRRLLHSDRSAESNSGEKPQEYSKCQRCGTFVQTKRLARHLLIHTGEKPFTCSLCGKNFIRKDALQAHMVVHTKERPFTCSVCGITTKRKAELRNHMFAHHPPPAGTSRAPAGAASRAPLGSSSRASSGASRAPLGAASRAPLGAASRAPLGAASRAPLGAASRAPVGSSSRASSGASSKKQCPICGKVVIYLRLHIKTHSGERPFSCSICGKRFTAKKNLQRHKLIHSRTRSVSCSSIDLREKQDVNKSEPSLIYCRIDD